MIVEGGNTISVPATHPSPWPQYDYDQLVIGRYGDGALTIGTDGKVISGNGYVGHLDNGYTGTVTVSGTDASWQSSGIIHIGYGGIGTMTIGAGGTVSNTVGYIGVLSTSNGAVMVSGAGASWQSSGNVHIGYSGIGTLDIEAGGTVASHNGVIGSWTGGNGTVTVSDASWQNSAGLYVGYVSAGALTIEAGGTVSNTAGYIGYAANSSGKVTVSGAGASWQNSGLLYVGGLGAGALSIGAGGTVSNTTGIIGGGAEGKATVSGADASWQNSQDLYVGYSSSGAMSVTDGGRVTNAGLGYIGFNANTTGVVTVAGTDGAGKASTWTSSGSLSVGHSGEGTLIIEGGGTVSNYIGTIGAQQGSNGTVSVSGQGARWQNAEYLLVGDYGTGNLDIGAGGRVTNTWGAIGSQAGSVGTVTVAGDGATWWYSSFLYVGDAGRGTLNIGAGGKVDWNSSLEAFIGRQAGSIGAVSVAGEGALWGNEYLFVGYEGAGTLDIGAGGTVKTSGFVANIGWENGSSGAVRVNGAGANWYNSGNLVVARNGLGTLDIGAGGLVTSTGGSIGELSGSNGAATIAGSDALWQNSSDLVVARNGMGTLDIGAGGTVTNASGTIGRQSGSSGKATVTGEGALWQNSGSLTIAYDGDGALDIGAGGTVTSNYARIGWQLGTGTVTVAGQDARWDNSGVLWVLGRGTLDIGAGGTVTTQGAIVDLHIPNISGAAVTVAGEGASWQTLGLTVGDQRDATLNIGTGGTVASLNTYIGFNVGSHGMVTVAGQGAQWRNANFLHIGSSGAGTLTIADGGLVSVADGAGTLNIADFNTLEPSTLNMGAAAGQPPVGIGRLEAAKMQFGAGMGTLVFNHTDADYVFDTALTSSGVGTHALDHLAGDTRLTGDSSAFTGITNVSSGTLTVANALGGSASVTGGSFVVEGTFGGSVAASTGGMVSGFGTITGDGDFTDGGVLAGTQGQTLTFGGSVLMDGTSVVNAALGGVPSDALFEVAGDLTLAGTLNVADQGGFGAGVYHIFDYGGVLAGSGLAIGTMPTGVSANNLAVQTGVANQVNLVSTSGLTLGFWDGGNAALHDNGAVDGGAGTWSAGGHNWVGSDGALNGPYQPNPTFAVFQNTGGLVTVDDTAGMIRVAGMQFAADGYEVAGDSVVLDGLGGQTLIRVGDGTPGGAGMTATIDSELTGVSTLVKHDRGTLILTGANTYTGGTILEAGTLILSGNNTYGGATVVNGGVLRANATDAFSAASAHTVAAGAVLDLNGHSQTVGSLAGEGSVLLVSGELTAGGNNTSTTFSGVMGGSGGLTKTGAGILTMTGANTYTGLTTIDQGTLSLGDGGAGGAVAGDIFNDNNFLVFNHSGAFIYAGFLSGTGATSFIGPGMTTLTGDSSGLGGQVVVTDGNLRIASGASLGATLLTVGADGTLSGFGTIAGSVGVEGRLAPGADALGAFAITGDVGFENDSIYAISIAGANPGPAPAATVDSLSVGGTADLTGGTVEIAAIDPRTSYVNGQTYTTPILTAAGGLGGTEFSDVGIASDSAFITPTLSYVGNDIFLTVSVTHDFTTVAETYNQFQAASALNGLEQNGDALTVFNTIANMDEDKARRALDLTSGEIHAAGQHVIDQTFALFDHTLRYQGMASIGAGNVGAQVFTAPLGYGPAVGAGNAGVVAIGDATGYADAHVRGAWAAPLGGFGHVGGDGNAAKLNWWNAGLAGGYEGMIDVASGHAVGGVGFGYIHSRGTLDSRLSTFDADGFYLGTYGTWTKGPWNVAGSLSYGANRVSTERDIAFMGRLAEADYWTHTIGLSGEASYTFELADTTRLAPLFTLNAGWSGDGGFAETGAGALNLTSGSESWTRLDAGLGLALTHTFLTENGNVTLEGRVVWEHAFAGVVPGQSLTFAGSPTNFTVLGPDAGHDRLRIGAGLSWDISDDMIVRARYDGLFSNRRANHSAAIGINIRF